MIVQQLLTVIYICEDVCLVTTVVWLFVTPWTIPASLLCLWNFPGKNTGVGWHFLHHGITLNPRLLHLLYCRQILYPWATRESPYTCVCVCVCVCISFKVINSSTAINIYMCVYKDRISYLSGGEILILFWKGWKVSIDIFYFFQFLQN